MVFQVSERMNLFRLLPTVLLEFAISFGPKMMMASRIMKTSSKGPMPKSSIYVVSTFQTHYSRQFKLLGLSLFW